MDALLATAVRQSSWSATATRLKSTLDRARWTNFILSVLGAVLATIASQLPDSEVRKSVAIAGAVVLAVATLITARLAGASHVGAWVRAREASEALKREGFKFAAKAAPYEDAATAGEQLTAERSAIEDALDDLGTHLVEVGTPGSVPTTSISPQDYVAQRVKGQIGYYRARASHAHAMARRLRTFEFVLALLTTVMTATVGVLDKYPLSGLPFDLAAFTAILTTIGATVLSHIEASRYDHLVRTYRVAARRLDNALVGLTGSPSAPSSEWSRFVEQCEGIISAENSSWSAKWSNSK